MIFKSTNLISEVFDQREVKYRIDEFESASVIEAAFKVTGGPAVAVRFISNSEKNDVAVRVFGLINEVPEEKRKAVLDACNRLSNEIRFVKFCLDYKFDVNVEYDFLANVSDECIGECCFELFARLMMILDQKFHVLAEALYAEGQDRKADNLLNALKMLQNMQENPISITEKENS